MTSKQRAYLRGMASNIDTILHIGKNGVTPEFIQSVTEALSTRELIKIDVLNNCFENPKDVGSMVAERSRSEVVQVIGRKIVLYKKFKDKPVIELPK